MFLFQQQNLQILITQESQHNLYLFQLTANLP